MFSEAGLCGEKAWSFLWDGKKEGIIFIQGQIWGDRIEKIWIPGERGYNRFHRLKEICRYIWSNGWIPLEEGACRISAG